jgi:hypothetical protein
MNYDGCCARMTVLLDLSLQRIEDYVCVQGYISAVEELSELRDGERRTGSFGGDAENRAIDELAGSAT